MAKKLYTLEIDEKNLETTTKAKAVAEKKTVAQSEVENFGIVEINNVKSKKTSVATKGFQKTVSGVAKKSVKAEASLVEDYFDFDLKAKSSARKAETAKVEEVKTAPAKKVAAKAEPAKKTVAAKKTCAKKATKAETKTEVSKKTSTILKVEAEHIEDIRNCQVQAEVCAYDDDARYNISVARMGSLFDCEKTMLS